MNVCECVYVLERSKRKKQRKERPRYSGTRQDTIVTPGSANPRDPLEEGQLSLKVLASTFSPGH